MLRPKIVPIGVVELDREGADEIIRDQLERPGALLPYVRRRRYGDLVWDSSAPVGDLSLVEREGEQAGLADVEGVV